MNGMRQLCVFVVFIATSSGVVLAKHESVYYNTLASLYMVF